MGKTEDQILKPSTGFSLFATNIVPVERNVSYFPLHFIAVNNIYLVGQRAFATHSSMQELIDKERTVFL